MSTTHNVAVIVGSLRKESFNRKMAHAVMGLAPEHLHCTIREIGDLPLYDQDLETATPPAPWQAFRDATRAADAFLFVTPEYNRSIPGGLKNAIDVGSRPMAHSVWSGKPGGVISVTQGMLGALAGNLALRQALAGVNVPVLPHPEVFVGQAATLFDESGNLTNDKTRELLQKYMNAYVQWIARNAKN